MMPQEMFHVTEEESINLIRFVLPSTIDTMEIDQLIELVMHHLEHKSNGRWVMDLSEVQYMGSSMLGLMVNMRERIRAAGGVLVLCGMSPQLVRIFQACCLERLFTVSKTRVDAFILVKRK